MPAKHLGPEWKREYLLGFGQAARDIERSAGLALDHPFRSPRSFEALAFTAFALGYRSGWRSADGG